MNKETCGVGQQGYACGISERLPADDGVDGALLWIMGVSIAAFAAWMYAMRKSQNSDYVVPKSNEDRSKDPNENIFG
jgi:cyanate permease